MKSADMQTLVGVSLYF